MESIHSFIQKQILGTTEVKGNKLQATLLKRQANFSDSTSFNFLNRVHGKDSCLWHNLTSLLPVSLDVLWKIYCSFDKLFICCFICSTLIILKI